MEQLLGGLLGGNEEEGRRAHQYIQRYEQGPPWEGITDEETQYHYQQVATRVPPDVYRRAAEEAFARLSPQERRQLVQQVKHQGKRRKMRRAAEWNEQEDSPNQLAQLMGQVQQEQPDMLGQLLGGAMGGGGNPLMKGALGGIAAMAMKQMMGGR